MPESAFRIHGVGCGVGDWIYSRIDFNSSKVRPYHSRETGDGGLEMGGVVFLDDLIRFANKSWEDILRDISDGAAPDSFNAGGPAMASSILTAQLLRSSRIPVVYYGLHGEDDTGSRLRDLLERTPLNLSKYARAPGRTPRAYVFSDPSARDGHGDRFFVHDTGMAADFNPAYLGEEFFGATFNVYAATVLVPPLHRELAARLERGRERGALNIVGTVFDFAAEKSAPGKPWTLGEGDAWPFIDLLVANEKEIFGLAGKRKLREAEKSGAALECAVETLLDKGLNSVVVTRGPEPAYYRSIGGVFGECRGMVPALPELVEKAGDRELHPGDTTGAGGNFLGALMADFLWQLLSDDNMYPKGEVHIDREALQIKPLRLRRAMEFAMAAGGLACLQFGGVRLEAFPGENLERIRGQLPVPEQTGKLWAKAMRRS